MIPPSIPHTDIVLDDNYDLVIVNGDFAVKQSQAQEANLIMKYQQGTLRQSPLTGVGIDNQINSDVDADTLKKLDSLIQSQFEMDDKTVDSIEYVTNMGQQLLSLNIDFEQNQ